MKFVNFRKGTMQGAGLLDGTAVLRLVDAQNGGALSLKEVVERRSSGSLDKVITDAAALELNEIELLPPIADPGKIICVGTNYESHRIETAREKTRRPPIFLRLTETLVGHRDQLVCPSESTMFDFEGEVAVVIGKTGRRISQDQALEHVFGYSCFNDASVRDWQRHTHQWAPGKNFDGTGAFGPWVVTPDEAGPPSAMRLITKLNGEIVQETTGDLMIFSIPEIIAYVSTFTTLRPGDVIATGTPGGVGLLRDPPLFMKPGDTVEVDVSNVGCLSNTVASA